MFNHLTAAVICSFAIVLVSYFFVLNLNESVMYAAVPYMRIYYFLFMLLGAITAIHTTKKVSSIKAAALAITGLILYYACMWVYKIDPFFCKFQIVSLFPLLFAIYWIYQFCNTEAISRILEKKPGRMIYFISSLTLEVYMVQYALFTDTLNWIFPLNIIFLYLAIILAAYILKCASHIFSQIFNKEPVVYKDIYQV